MDLSLLRIEGGIKALIGSLRDELSCFGRQISIMEVCGTHTMTAYRSGLGGILRKMGIKLISGPGCPVCVTPDSILAAAASLVKNREGVILASFGDMMRVPTNEGLLMKIVPAAGSQVRVIYSPEEVLQIAASNPGREVVFLAAGFETTIPSIGWLVRECMERKLKNIAILPAMKIVPPPLKAILEAGEVRIDGFIYPGHVSVIIGSAPYRFIAEDYGVPGAVAGFEPVDLLLGIISVVRQVRKGEPEVDIVYRRGVRPEGNLIARRLMEEVFEVRDARWRGFGNIPMSGLYPPGELDAFERYDLEVDFQWEIKGCRCGEVVRGVTEPEDCPLFGRGCTPEKPVGPCMVSFEGSCLIHYKYGKEISIGED